MIHSFALHRFTTFPDQARFCGDHGCWAKPGPDPYLLVTGELLVYGRVCPPWLVVLETHPVPSSG